MSYNVEEIVNVGALSNGVDQLWVLMFEYIQKDPTARQIEDVAAGMGWGREKFATVLAAALLVRSEEQRQEMLKTLCMTPAPPIKVTLPSPENRGTGC